MLWEVDTKPKIYLFGTIHVGDPRVIAHPPVVQKALDASQALYTEIELTPKDIGAMVKRMRLPEGQSLKTLLPIISSKKTGWTAAPSLPNCQ